MTDLLVELAGIPLQNPIMSASGTFDVEAFSDIFGFDIGRLGAIVPKGVTLKSWNGNA